MSFLSLKVSTFAPKLPGTFPEEDALRSDLSHVIIAGLAQMMAVRDESMREHAERVRRYAVALAREVAIADERTINAIDVAALLHDVGKLGIPDRVLQKPGPLTRDEYEQVKQHPVIGADLLSALPFPGPLSAIVRHHHESWDGTGYPDGLRGDAIPLGARLLAIVDCYDALTSDRPYRRALSHQSAIGIIAERRGTMYDPNLTDTFLRIVQRLHAGIERAANHARVRAAWMTRGETAVRLTDKEARAV